MSKKGGILVICLNVALFIILEWAALVILKNNGEAQNTWLAKGAHAFMSGVWGTTERISGYFSLRQENEDLYDQIYRQEQQLRRYREITGQDFSADTIPQVVAGFRYIPATVVKSAKNTQHNYIIISKGSEDGIEPKSGIITEKGVIGIIDAVSRHYSYGRSFRNFDMTVSARIGKEGSVGSLSWDGITSNGAILREVPQHIIISPGDTVYTSGYSSIFPADIPIGILGEYKIKNGSMYEIKVKLFEDFSSMRFVTVVNNVHADEIDELEGER